jgi:TonB family protein
MKPILYRPGSKWPLVLAFVSAAAIHVSALALSPAHSPEITAGDVITEIDANFPPADPEPSLEPPQEAVSSVTPPASTDEDVPEESPSPLRIWKKARPIRVQAPPVIARSFSADGKVFALSAPLPNYPYEARARHITGSGAVNLRVDSTTGEVLNAVLVESTGNLILDHSALAGFRRWRFRTGTPATVRIPFTFTLSGARL